MKEFNQQFTALNLIYKDCIDKEVLYEEWLKTDLKPDVNKYLSTNELEERDLYLKFIKLKNKNKLPDKYFSHFIKETETAKVLSKIETLFDTYNKGFSDSLNAPKNKAEQIITQLEILDNVTAKNVANKLISEKENKNFVVMAIVDNEEPTQTKLLKWKSSKDVFNQQLNEWLQNYLKSEEKENKKDYPTERLWFKVGLKLATGEMDKYYNKNKSAIRSDYTAPKITKELGLESTARPYISTTLNDNRTVNNLDKNIFANSDKIKTIKDYCNNYNIEIAQSFLDKTS